MLSRHTFTMPFASPLAKTCGLDTRSECAKGRGRIGRERGRPKKKSVLLVIGEGEGEEEAGKRRIPFGIVLQRVYGSLVWAGFQSGSWLDMAGLQ